MDFEEYKLKMINVAEALVLEEYKARWMFQIMNLGINSAYPPDYYQTHSIKDMEEEIRKITTGEIKVDSLLNT